ncbi:MAG: hypothetical protein AB1896_05540 [Thermodesulfobacteriota bacterium]
MTKKEELVLKAAKEIVVKFIETGRVYPSSFEENYRLVCQVVRDSIKDEG